MTLREEGRLPPHNVDSLLLWARRGNTGDWLIADASERFLQDLGLSVWRSDGSVEDAAEADDAAYLGDLFSQFRGMIVFAGGGNIGIYPDNARMRAGVIARLGPRHRCLVLPQSALAPEPALARSGVTVWCRDAVSEALLRAAGSRTELVPDIALYMDDRIPKSSGGEGVIYVRRTPGGDAETIDHGIVPGCAAADLTLTLPLGEVIAALAPYAQVLSDRLHGGLIALMMRKPTVFLPVGYHKIRAFYETWLRGAASAAYVDRQADLSDALARLGPANDDLGAMFRERALPAFDRFLQAG